MLYERFQNLDLDKAELEVFKLFFWIPLFFLSIGAWFESAFVFSKYQYWEGSWYEEEKRGNNITTSFVALSPCKHA
jgi:hypothetical protein